MRGEEEGREEGGQGGERGRENGDVMRGINPHLKPASNFLSADGAIVSEPVQQVFERVRNNADFMPTWQMEVR